MTVISYPREHPEKSLGFIVWQASSLWEKKLTDALKSIDLSQIEFLLLSGIERLGKQYRELTQIMLAKYVKTDVMLASKALRSLEKKNLIVRVTHRSDMRAKNLYLSVVGTELLEQARRIIEDLESQFFAQFGERYADVRETLINLLMNKLDEI